MKTSASACGVAGAPNDAVNCRSRTSSALAVVASSRTRRRFIAWCLLGSPGGSRTNESRSAAFLGLAAHQLAAWRTNVCVQASAALESNFRASVSLH